ncbi:MAG: type II toxin-antitoxin system VapC family toxin [Gammaproteobacteria bacterium]
MIAADTSALVAIALGEPEREPFLKAMLDANMVLISTVSVVETRMVVHARRGERAVVLIDDLLRLPMFEILPPGPAEMNAAFAAFVAYGKGSGHPAALNFGDLFSYALAKVRSIPLLFKGNDFSHTDLIPACEPTR